MSEDAADTSETSVNFYQTTRRNNPEELYLKVQETCKVSNLSHVSVFSLKFYSHNFECSTLFVKPCIPYSKE
jgi:hypothetical protein